ncbi:MAG: hypothetical protein FJ267_09465 [Planctomycetes bacterium]|nr:hypothetical protein [Planctomycetota bacterium]
MAHREAPLPSLVAVHATQETCSDGKEQNALLTSTALEDLNAVFQKMIAKKPEDRFGSMLEVVTALTSIQASLANESTVIFHPHSNLTQPSDAPTTTQVGVGNPATFVGSDGETTPTIRLQERSRQHNKRLIGVAASAAVVISTVGIWLGMTYWERVIPNPKMTPKVTATNPVIVNSPGPRVVGNPSNTLPLVKPFDADRQRQWENELLQGKKLDLIPLVNLELMGDGVAGDVTSVHDELTLDASTARSPNLWLNFPTVRGNRMTVRTKIRVTNPHSAGFVKFVFKSEHDIAEVYAIIANLANATNCWIETSSKKRSAGYVKLELPADRSFIDVIFTIDHDRLQLRVNDQPVIETARPLTGPVYLALSSNGWKVDIKAPYVICH